jgi:hypothetical protein
MTIEPEFKPQEPRNSIDFGVFCYLEYLRLDFGLGRMYIIQVTSLITSFYGSGLRNGTYSVFELVNIKVVVKGSTSDRRHRGDGVGNRR